MATMDVPAGMPVSRPDFVELEADVSAQPALEQGPRADAAVAPHLVDVQHRRALDRHVRGHHHLHPRLGADVAGDDLGAGARRRSSSATSSCSSR